MLRERFERLFRGNEDWFGQYEATPEGEKIRAWTAAGPVPDEAWDRHLAGEQPGLGVVPITEGGSCYWGAIDLDDDDTDHADLVKRVRGLGLPLVVCRSKSGGAHLFLFFREPIKPVHLIAKLKRWSLTLELENPPDEQGRRQELEIFPKQIRLTAGQKGNWLNLPYFGGDETTRYGVGDDGERLSLEEFLDLAESYRLTENQLEVSKAQVQPDSALFFHDGPPCLQALHQEGFVQGSRNQGLYNVGIYLKLRHPDDWPDVLREYNEKSGKLDPPLPSDEVDNIIRSLERRDYIYKCNDVPIQPHCDRAACKRQPFGIERFQRDADHAAFPTLGRLISFENQIDDPIYILEVAGKSVTFTPDELLTMSLFRKVVYRQSKKVVPQLRQKDWDDRLRDLMENHIVVGVPEDAGPQGQLLVHLNDFLLLRHKADREEDLLDNQPYEKDGRVYFRSQALIEHLEKVRFRDVNVNGMGLWNMIRRQGGGFTSIPVAGRDLEVWWVPVPGNEQTEDFSPRTYDDPEF